MITVTDVENLLPTLIESIDDVKEADRLAMMLTEYALQAYDKAEELSPSSVSSFQIELVDDMARGIDLIKKPT